MFELGEEAIIVPTIAKQHARDNVFAFSRQRAFSFFETRRQEEPWRAVKIKKSNFIIFPFNEIRPGGRMQVHYGLANLYRALYLLSGRLKALSNPAPKVPLCCTVVNVSRENSLRLS